MKPFRFRVDALLDLRRRRRDAAQADLAQAERAVQAAAAAVTDADVRRQQAASAFVEALAAGGEAPAFERHRNWIAHLAAETASLQEVLEDRTRARATAATILRTAHQEVRVLERLKDRARQRYDTAARKLETKAIDEVTTLRYSRRFEQRGVDRDT